RRIALAVVQVVVVGQLFARGNVAQGDDPHAPALLVGVTVRIARMVDERGHAVSIDQLVASAQPEQERMWPVVITLVCRRVGEPRRGVLVQAPAAPGRARGVGPGVLIVGGGYAQRHHAYLTW